jgi:hypothetical protein
VKRFKDRLHKLNGENRIPVSAKSDNRNGFFEGSTADGFCTLLNKKVTAILPPKREVGFAYIGY